MGKLLSFKTANQLASSKMLHHGFRHFLNIPWMSRHSIRFSGSRDSFMPQRSFVHGPLPFRARSGHGQGIAGFPPKVRGYGGADFFGSLRFAAGHVHLSQLLSLSALLLPKGPFPERERPSLKINLDVFTIAPRIFVGGGGGNRTPVRHGPTVAALQA